MFDSKRSALGSIFVERTLLIEIAVDSGLSGIGSAVGNHLLYQRDDGPVAVHRDSAGSWLLLIQKLLIDSAPKHLQGMSDTTHQPKLWSDWQLALASTIVLRLIYSAIAAALSFVLHPSSALIRSNALTTNLPAAGNWSYAFAGVWQRFDTLWYLRIAQHGYDQPMAVIFYPLYPATIRVVSCFLPAAISALILSTTGAFFFFWGMLRVAGPELSPLGRVRMLALIAVWPSSFILFAGYAESLTAALIVWAVIFGRGGRWWPAVACGFLAGLARPSGVLVAIPLLLLAWKDRRASSFLALLTPLGTLGYWGWLWRTGRPSVVAAYGLYQATPFAPPWRGLWLTLRTIAHGDTLLGLKLGLIVLAAIFAFRASRLEDKLFATAVILQMFMYTGRPIIGAARYVLVIYPTFVALAVFAERRWNRKQFAFYASALGFLNLMWMVAFLRWSLVL
jgi:hypothetical protein